MFLYSNLLGVFSFKIRLLWLHAHIPSFLEYLGLLFGMPLEITFDKCKIIFFLRTAWRHGVGGGGKGDRRIVTSLILKLDTKQDSQCRYIVIFRHVIQPLLQRTSNEYYATWMCAFVVLVIQHAMRMCHIAICGLSRSTYFSKLSYKRYHIRKNVFKQKMCVLIFSAILFETFLILRRNQ